MTNLLELADRVEAGEETSGRICLEIALSVLGWEMWQSKHGYWNVSGPNGEKFTREQYGQPFHSDDGSKNDHYHKPPYEWIYDRPEIDDVLVSLDAAKALHDAVLPGWEWSTGVNTDGNDAKFNTFVSERIEGVPVIDGYAANPASSWVAAILRAKHSMNDEVE